MTRHPDDQTILLLAHGELSAWRSLWLQGHLRRCWQCRARYADLTQTSAALAAALRGPDAAPWQPALRTVKARFVFASLLVAVLLVGALCGLAYRAAHAPPSTSGSTLQTTPATEGCAPDLPSDRCR